MEWEESPSKRPWGDVWYGRALQQRVVQPPVRSEQQWRGEWSQRFVQPTMREVGEEGLQDAQPVARRRQRVDAEVLQDAQPVARRSKSVGVAEPTRSREGLCAWWGVRIGVAGVLALAVWLGAQLQQEQRGQHELEKMEELQLVADTIAAPRLGADGEDRGEYAPRNQSGVGRKDSVVDASDPWADREPPAEGESDSWLLLIGLSAAMGCAACDLWQRRSAAVRTKHARQRCNDLIAANADLRGELRKLRASRDEAAAEAEALRDSMADMAAAKAETDEQLDTALSEVFRLTKEATSSQSRPDNRTAADLDDLQGGRRASLERWMQTTQQKADAYKQYVTMELVPQIAETCYEIGVANERRQRAFEDCQTEVARATQIQHSIDDTTTLSPVFTPDASSPMMAGSSATSTFFELTPEPEPEPAGGTSANFTAEEFFRWNARPGKLPVECKRDRELESIREQLQSAQNEVDELEAENEQLNNRITDAEKRSAAQEATLRALHCLYDLSSRIDAFAAFRSFDTNGDGHVSRAELATGLEKLSPGLSLSAVDVDALMSLLVTDNEGRVAYAEFTRLGTYSVFPSAPLSAHTQAETQKKACVPYC